MIDISIVMPCWIINEGLMSLTEAAVESLNHRGRLIIIDNGSPMGGGKLRELADVYIRNKENLGYARAVNQGLKLSGDIVAVANNDIRVSPNWANVAKVLIGAGAGSVHYRMIPYDQPFNPGSESWAQGKERWCSSSFFVMKNVQLYDEEYLNSLEDWDYWRRFRESGYCTVYTNEAEYQHLDSHTQQFVPARSDNDKKNLDHYVKKWGETPDQWLARMYPEQLSEPWKPFP